jgi:hypothetical protein
MIKTFKCIKSFFVEDYDGDGFCLNTASCIKEGDMFEYDTEDKSRVVGADDTIRLINDKRWLEITEDTVNGYFEEVTENE